MNKVLRILFIEDSEDDALIELLQIKKGGYEIEYKRVETAEGMKIALKDESWDIILSDYKMPQFTGLDALLILKDSGIDIPFLVVSGAIGEEVAVEAMKAGAHDYMMKNNLKRLLPTVERELREALIRAERKQLEQKQKEAEQERLANLHFFESMNKINRAIQEASDLNGMMGDVLSAVLTIFDCDRASLVYPCDPNAVSCQVQMERTKPEYPGALALGLEVVIDYGVAKLFQTILDSDCPVQFGANSEHQSPETVVNQFKEQSELAVAIHPIGSKPYMFNLHQCSFPRVWTGEEKRLFNEIGRRLTESLTSLIIFRDLQESEKKYRRIVDTAAEGIWILGPDATTTFVNARMAEIIGTSIENIVGKPMADFLVEDELPDHKKRMENRRKRISENYECRFNHKDGRVIWALASAVPLFDEKNVFGGSFAMFTDITNRKNAEAQILRLNRIYAVLSNINETVVRISNIDLLLYEVCRIAIEYGQFRMVWIGMVNSQTNIVDVVASSGFTEDYLSKITINLNDESISNGTVGKSIKSFQYSISNDIENDAGMLPWRADALRLGYKSVASFPLIVLGKVIGTINLYSSEVAFFSDQEIQLLNEMAMDVSFALEAIDHQVERNRAEEKLIESEERYRRITEGLTDYLYTVRVKDGNAIETIHNEACFFITGYTSGEFEADSYLWFNMIMPEEREMVTQKFAKILEGKDLPPIEHRIICKDGTVRWISDTPIPKYNSDGKLTSYEGVIKDITVHKQNEEALLKLKKAVDSSGEVIFLTDNEGTFTYTNPAFTTLYGFSAEEVIRKATPRILKSSLYDTSYYQKFWRILSDGGEAKGEIINKRKDGKLLTIENTANPIVDENNNIIGFLGVQRDISERKKAEELLLSKTLLLETQLETSIDGIVVVDNNGHTIIFNKRFCKLWGIPKEVIRAKEKIKMLEYVAPKLKHPAEFLRNVEYLTQNPDEKNREEIQLIDGRFFDRYTASMLDDSGKNYGRIWFFRDITRRKMTEIALIESEEKFRKLAETANDSILIIDSEGTIISWNKAAELTFGYSFSEVSGKNIEIILQKKYKSLQPKAFREMTTEGDSILPSKTIKLEALKKNKKAFPIELSLSLWEANNTTYFTAIIRDISARVKIEQELATYRNHLEELVKARTKELNRANELLRQKIAKDEEYEMMLQQSLEKEKELSEMKSRFISTTSHEFRTPLTSILSSTELLQRYSKRWDEQKRDEHLNRIKSSVDYLVNLLDDVLTISRTEAGKITFKPAMVKLKDLVMSYVEEVKSLLKENHHLKLNIKTKQEEFFLDAKLLKFIIGNLLSNAIKYSPCGGNITLTISTSNDQLIIEVSDEGIGIPAEDKDSIFSAFYRTKNVNEISGTGLGLAIVKRAVDLHYGEIHVESELDKGTIFITKIPLRSEEQ